MRKPGKNMVNIEINPGQCLMLWGGSPVPSRLRPLHCTAGSWCFLVLLVWSQVLKDPGSFGVSFGALVCLVGCLGVLACSSWWLVSLGLAWLGGLVGFGLVGWFGWVWFGSVVWFGWVVWSGCLVVCVGLVGLVELYWPTKKTFWRHPERTFLWLLAIYFAYIRY